MKKRMQWIISLLLLVPLVSLGHETPRTHAQSQDNARTFPQTGKTVSGEFLQYWDGHGGLAQQGYPISDQQIEVSDSDGKPYVVQYFERAVFELHPENTAPYGVLLALLGVFYYAQRYPASAPEQIPDNSQGAILFKETGHTLGGKFLAYWQQHGALVQQGYPISDMFNEMSALDGKSYTVQYFERAVFEMHPEFAGTANEVLLSQLGTFRYQQKYSRPAPSLTPTAIPILQTPTPLLPTPTNVASPPPNSDCTEVPASTNVEVVPNCGKRGTRFVFTGKNFRSFERVAIWVTDPDQSVYGAEFEVEADQRGNINGVYVPSDNSFQLGIWAITMRGHLTNLVGIGYFKVIIPVYGSGDCSGIPAAQSMIVKPRCAPGGVDFEIEASDFQRGEAVGRYYTSPTGEVIPGSSQSIANGSGTVTGIAFHSTVSSTLGLWAATFEGTESHHKATGYFKVTHP